MAGSALAGGMSSDKEAQALQLQADEAKRRAEPARAAAK
jgi:hypothetical protein